MPVSVASTTRAPAASICGKLMAICRSRSAAVADGGPQLGASGRRSMVARIVAITESGSACSKNGSGLADLGRVAQPNHRRPVGLLLPHQREVFVVERLALHHVHEHVGAGASRPIF